MWMRLGRNVIGNLTTVSSSVRDFTTTLLGYYFANRLADDIEASDLDTFLKFEQLAAYSRAYMNGDKAMRGTERVQRRLAEAVRKRVVISADASHQILSDQKTYGLWGLYTVPSRASGFLTDPPTRLTPQALEIVEGFYLPRLAKAVGREARGLVDILKQDRTNVELDGKHQAIVRALGAALAPQLGREEISIYRHHLVHGGPQDPTSGRQRQLASLLDSTLHVPSFSFSPAVVSDFAKKARKRGEEWRFLEKHLLRIRIAEAVLAPSAALFSHVLGTHGRKVDELARRVRDQWSAGLRTVDVEGFKDVKDEMTAGDVETGNRWFAIAEALSTGDYRQAIELLARQNATVMRARGGVPWLEFRGDRIEVRYRDERGELPTRRELPHLWRFPYFLGSLRAVTMACEGSGVKS
jgi:hypothetical protein